MRLLLLTMIVCGQFLLLPLARAELPKEPAASSAGTWHGVLKSESQDSYRGNNAKGAHRVSSEEWTFRISPDERTVAFRYANSLETIAFLVRKKDRALTWHVSTKASTGMPFTVVRNGRRVGTGITTVPDYDADWTLRITSCNSATILCTSNREDIYARITDTRITGTLTKK